MDNWTKLRALYFIEPQGLDEEVEVKEMIQNAEWNIPRLRQIISEDMVEYIVEKINPVMEGVDKAWWMGNSHGEFTVNSAFQVLRRKREEQEWMNYNWIKGINIEGLHLQQLITTWWEWPAKHKLKQILNAMPAIIMWELCKRRNARRHGRAVSYVQMRSQCQQTVQMLLKVRYPWIKGGNQNWKELITNGACRGNPGQSSYGFSIKDKNGDLIYVEAQLIGEATNMEAKIMGVWKAL
ncbi:hypothetical protein KY284_022310 [Solanum tuberosum]|nr:hypothetical protein KY284_022310 [Solanum tuberosum]